MQINKLQLSRLVQNNHIIWKQCKEKPQKFIYFENNYESWLYLMLDKFITAKALEEKSGMQVIALNEKPDSNKEAVYDSFGFDWRCFGFNLGTWDKLCSYARASLEMLLCRNNMEKLLDLSYKGVHIGDLVYDHIIRNELPRYSVKKLQGKKDFIILQKAFFLCRYCEKLFRKNKPGYFIAGDLIYFNGFYIRFAIKYGAEIFEICTGRNTRHLVSKRQKYYPNYHFTIREEIREKCASKFSADWKSEMNKHLDQLFMGIGDINARAAYLNKQILKKEEILEKIGVKNDKKNIVIMAHCFSDAPHCGGKFLYNDYYEWLIETLKIVSGISTVNWILKPHPRRSFYKEDGAVEKIYESYSTDNLYWMPDDYSTATLRAFADAIVTVGGTAGIEFSCVGIPCVNAGSTFYTGYGITIQPKSIDEYTDILSKMDKIRPLSQKKVEKAREILYLKNKMIYEMRDEELQKLMYDGYMDLLEDMDERRSNNRFVDDYLDYIKNNDIRKCYFYQFAITNQQEEICTET